jgi:uncharacterized protein YdeI (YjbR/CyaY-like superfamily)
METFDNRVDLYIIKSAPFAQPLLEYIREVVHEASPLITETIKWGFPFFEYKGAICQVAAFKQHCAFGFWKVRLLNDPQQVLKLEDGKAGNFGPLKSIEDLPPRQVLTDFVLQAIALNEKGEKNVAKKPPVDKGALIIPGYFIDFLSAHPQAKEVFGQFSPSQKREYTEWIDDAKTAATRQKRMETAVEWISEGKTRNWKYQR